MKNSEQPITPCIMQRVGNDSYRLSKGDGDPKEWRVPMAGLTKREYFAAMAMQGLLAKEAWLERNESDSKFNTIIAKASVNIADQLLNELEKPT